jgi:hypothetical protein
VGITEKTLGRQTRSVVPVLEPRSKPNKSRFFEEEEEDEDDDDHGKDGGDGGAGGDGGEASSAGKKSGKAGKKPTEAPPLVLDALKAEEDGAEAAAGPVGEAEEGSSGKVLSGRTAPPALASAPRPLMVTRSLSAYIHVSRDDGR